jgi:CRISPR-associated endoribonuclease Cas6
MRVSLHLTPNTEPVPFNYQPVLVGAFHHWLGENDLHDDISLYSLSWLTKGRSKGSALDFPDGSTFFVSAPSPDLLSGLIEGVQAGWMLRWGMQVDSITIERTPVFGDYHRFYTQSPVLIKRRDESGNRYFYPSDAVSGQYLTETMLNKLRHANLPQEVEVSFDAAYEKPKTKLIDYKGIKIRASFCPVIVKGHPRAVQFAWEVGVGNSTGIGFGALI